MIRRQRQRALTAYAAGHLHFARKSAAFTIEFVRAPRAYPVRSICPRWCFNRLAAAQSGWSAARQR